MKPEVPAKPTDAELYKAVAVFAATVRYLSANESVIEPVGIAMAPGITKSLFLPAVSHLFVLKLK